MSPNRTTLRCFIRISLNIFLGAVTRKGSRNRVTFGARGALDNSNLTFFLSFRCPSNSAMVTMNVSTVPSMNIYVFVSITHLLIILNSSRVFFPFYPLWAGGTLIFVYSRLTSCLGAALTCYASYLGSVTSCSRYDPVWLRRSMPPTLLLQRLRARPVSMHDALYRFLTSQGHLR